MRVSVTGNSPAADSVRGQMLHTGLIRLTLVEWEIQVAVETHPKRILVEGVSCPLENKIVNAIGVCLVDAGLETPIVLKRNGSIKTDDTVKVSVPESENVAAAVEKGIVLGVLRFMNVENDQRNKPAKWYRRWMNALSIPLLLCGMTAAQVSKGTTTTVQPDGTKLHVTVDTCVSGCAGGPGGGGTSAVDEATFTQGTTQYVPIGGLFNSAITNLVSGQGGALRLTADRAAFVNVSHYGGAVVGATNPFFVTPGTGAIFSVSQNGAPWLTQSFIFNTAQPNYSVDATKAYPNISSRGELFIAKGISGLSIDNTGFNVNNFPATQAVTQSGAWTTGRTWTLLNTTDSVNVGNFPASFQVSNFPATQPVSGTVTANQGTANTAANAWPAKVTDGTNTAAVKAASTAALATDPSLVVGFSPNSPLPPGTNSIGSVVAGDPSQTGATVALGALNAACTVSLKGNAGAGMQLAAGTLIGTLTPEISYDGGTTWIASVFFDALHNTVAPTFIFTASNTATALTVMAGNGVTDMRVRVSAFTSGTANCTMRATNSDAQLVVNTPIDGKKMTYRAAFTGQACVASATAPCATVYGSSTKTLRITHIKASATAATAALEALQAIKFSTAASAGTSSAMVAIPLDSNYSATTATGLLKYTAAPTAGTAVGAVCSQRGLEGSATVTGNLIMECNFGGYPGGSAVVLRGTAQGIGLIVTIAGSVDFEVEWTEE